jgi:hypothetical protein
LAKVDLYTPFERAMMTERTFGLWCFDTWRRDPAQLPGALGVEDVPLASLIRMTLRAGPLIKKDQVFYLRYMADRVALARQHHHIRQPALPSEDEPDFPFYASISRMITPVFTSAHNKRDETIAQLGLAQWALALHIYRQKKGRYPADLQEVDALLDWGLPADPFSERPFVYRRDGAGYLLYSIGVNGRDDKGETDRARHSPPSLSRSSVPPRYVPFPPDDIAWRAGR